MSSTAEAIREQLMAGNTEFQRLRDEHARLSAQLEHLTSKHYLSEEEQIEEVRLKKLKLRAKDQMEMMIHKALVA